MNALTPADFGFVRTLVQSATGMVLEPGKEYLVETRLAPVARRHGFRDLTSLLREVRTHPGGGLQDEVAGALTVNETSFFRDHHPYVALEREILPDLIARAPSKRLRIWSAACSTGQEPYSLAMLLLDRFPELASWDVTIEATDIAAETLLRAVQGAYTQAEINRGLPARLLVRYFRQQRGRWWVSEEVRSLVTFRRLNLTQPWPATDPYDLILMRNVLIYFDVPAKQRILAQVRGRLRTGGAVLLGTAETTHHLDAGFEREEIGGSYCYRVRTDGAPVRSPGR